MSRHGRIAMWIAGLVGVLYLSMAGMAQDAAPAEAPAEAPAGEAAVTTEKPRKAQLFSRNLESSHLFEILRQLYHVQFENTESVTGKLTLISPGGQAVDIHGMLGILNQALAAQGKVANWDENVIRIEEAKDIIDQPIWLARGDKGKVAQVLQDRFLAKQGEPAQDKAVYILVHPELEGILVGAKQDVIEEIRRFIEDTQLATLSGTPVIALPEQAVPVAAKGQAFAPLEKRYYVLEYMDVAEFQALVQGDPTVRVAQTLVGPNNTLVVFSRYAEDFAKLGEMQQTFDVDRMEIRILPLKNANPKNVAELLTAVYGGVTGEEAVPAEQQAARLSTGPYGEGETYTEELTTLRALERAGVVEPHAREMLSRALLTVPVAELTIIPDEQRSALLIRTWSRNFKKITDLVDALDKARDQVLIDVFITEVTLDKNLALGVDFTWQHNDDTGQQFFPGTSVTETGQGIPTGLTYQLISDNITAFIRALQEDNRLDIITRPQVLTKDNMVALISLGRKVPLVTTTNVSTGGAVNSAVEYENVVTSLQVTPQIHPDGFVTMVLEQKIDEVSTETFQISENFNPQVIVTRTAKTEVRVHDGQTVCLGGFVGHTLREVERKVPLLGDIPVAGVLFKYMVTERKKTELILFITPHIIRNPQEMLRMTNSMRHRSDAKVRTDGDTDVLELQRDLVYPSYREPVVEGAEMTPGEALRRIRDLEVQLQEQAAARQAAEAAAAEQSRLAEEAARAAAEAKAAAEKPVPPATKKPAVSPKAKPPAGKKPQRTPKAAPPATDKPAASTKPASPGKKKPPTGPKPAVPSPDKPAEK